MTDLVRGLALAIAIALLLVPGLDAQLPTATDDRLAGLQWRFVRIKYHDPTEGTGIAKDF